MTNDKCIMHMKLVILTINSGGMISESWIKKQ